MERFLRYFFAIIFLLAGITLFFLGPITCMFIGSKGTGWGVGGLIGGIALIALAYTIRPRR